MTTNSQILAKADNILTTAGMSPGSKLQPEVGSKLITNIWNLSGLKDRVTTLKFKSGQKKVSLFTLDERITFPKLQGLDTGRLGSYITTDVDITPFTWKVVVEIPYEVFDQNIEGNALKKTIIDAMSKKIGNELEQAALHGNTLGRSVKESFLDPKNGSTSARVLDPLYSQFDGWLKTADANIYDAEYSNDMLQIFNDLLNSLPEEYKMDPAALRFMLPTILEQQYIFQTSGRNSALGDAMLLGTMSAQAFKVPLLALPLFGANAPKVEHVTLTGTTPVALDYTHIVAANVFVNDITLTDKVAVQPYVDTTDYVITSATGTIERSGSSSDIVDGSTVKVSYQAPSETLLSDPINFLIGMNTDDMRIQTDLDIKRDVVIIAMSGSFDAKTLRQDAVRKAINIKQQSALS